MLKEINFNNTIEREKEKATLTKVAKKAAFHKRYKICNIEKNKFYYYLSFYEGNEALTTFWLSIDRMNGQISVCKPGRIVRVYKSLKEYMNTKTV